MSYRYENLYIMHYGVGHDKGGHSGRYPWGSGENPYGGKGTKSLYKKQKGKYLLGMSGGAIGGGIAAVTGNSGDPIQDMGIKWNNRKVAENKLSKKFEKKYGNILNFSLMQHMMELRSGDTYKDFLKEEPGARRHVEEYRDLLIQNRKKSIDELKKYAGEYDIRTLYTGDGKKHPFTSKDKINLAKNFVEDMGMEDRLNSIISMSDEDILRMMYPINII